MLPYRAYEILLPPPSSSGGVLTAFINAHARQVTAGEPAPRQVRVNDDIGPGQFLGRQVVVGEPYEGTRAVRRQDGRIDGLVRRYTDRAADGLVQQELEALNSSGGLDDSTIYSFTVGFEPNQDSFSSSQYGRDFDRVLDLATEYAAASPGENPAPLVARGHEIFVSSCDKPLMNWFFQSMAKRKDFDFISFFADVGVDFLPPFRSFPDSQQKLI